MLTMMKFVIPTFVLFTLFLSKNLALDSGEYTAYIEELSRNETFLEEYTKWSSELFSQRDYIYGDFHAQFPCSINKSNDGNNSIPTSVHTLRPSDIKCIGAMGDSFTTGLGARAITPNDLLLEDRGISWSVGGDYTYSKILTLPNILRLYNPKLKGFSTKAYVMSDNRLTDTQLNVAISGDHSNNMLQQAGFLIDRLKNEKFCDWNNDWKMITIFIGRNDLCSFCEDLNVTKYSPKQYLNDVHDTLDKLYYSSIPRTLINLVLPPDVRVIKDLNNGSYICQTLLQRICPCAAFPTAEQAKILDDYIPQYHQGLLDLINSRRYEERDDFTVVIQPFMSKTKLPYKDNNTIDFSYFAPDCFHLSGKGHSQAALSLWNNMFEPVGNKRDSWHMGKSLKCPTKEYSYIFTSKNSANRTITIETSSLVPTINNNSYTTNNQSSNINNIDNNSTYVNITTDQPSMMSSNSAFTSDINATTNPGPTINNISTSRRSHNRGKNKKSNSDSDSSFKKMKFLTITGFLFIITMILIVGILRRRNQHRYFNQTETNQFQYTNEDLDDDEVEIYNQTKESGYVDDNQITKTHGKRMSLE